jgi:uncharacterized protein YggU (UPF0235/DUF167 family)
MADGHQIDEEDPVSFLKDGRIRIKFYVKPGAKKSQVVSTEGQFIGIQVFFLRLAPIYMFEKIAAPPRDGEANEEVLRWTAERLGVRPRHLELVSGHKSRDKVIVLSSLGVDLSIEQVRSRLFS